jgi:hypothetical protein
LALREASSNECPVVPGLAVREELLAARHSIITTWGACTVWARSSAHRRLSRDPPTCSVPRYTSLHDAAA